MKPALDDKSSGIYYDYQRKQAAMASSKFLDEIKFEATGARFRKSQPFWIHYMWTNKKYNGRQG